MIDRTAEYPLGTKLRVMCGDGEVREVTVIAHEYADTKVVVVGLEYEDGYRHPVPVEALERGIQEGEQHGS